jgi:hypothetical protein
MVKSEIEEVEGWDDLTDPCHKLRINTKEFAETGETLGLIRPEDAMTDRNLEDGIENVIAAIDDGIFDENQSDDTCENLILSSQVLTESASWVAKELSVARGIGKVQTDEEIQLFRKHHLQFQKGNEDNEANNYSSFAWARMMIFWMTGSGMKRLGSDPEVR